MQHEKGLDLGSATGWSLTAIQLPSHRPRQTGRQWHPCLTLLFPSLLHLGALGPAASQLGAQWD